MSTDPVSRSPESRSFSEVGGGREQQSKSGKGRDNESGSVTVDAGPEVLYIDQESEPRH